ncbi:MAG: hypothetical protein RBT63_08055, partial [Bdellovibrionales bacterium]|nr:hypothetical protein [Bdellovibrionales bacterium]
TALSHEGHDHDAPGLVLAPRGGDIRSLEELHVEVLTQGKDIKIYLYSQDLKPLDTSRSVQISATAEIPARRGAKAKPEVLKMKSEGGGLYTTSFDAKSAHRFILNLKIIDSKTKHDDTLTFSIEAKR